MADEARAPTPEDLEWLRQNPEEHSQGFDLHFGEGAAQAALAGAPPAPVEAPAEVPTEAPAEEEQGYLEWAGEGLADMGRGAVEGVANAISETADFAPELMPAPIRGAMEGVRIAADAALGGAAAETGEAPAPTALADDALEAATGLTAEQIIPVPVTALGKVTSSLTQFIAGMAGAGKLTGLRGVAGGFANGAIADAVVFDPEGGNLSRLMADNDFAVPLLTEALATDPDDPEWMNRMRNATEGVVAGALVETTIRGFRAIALSRRAAQSGDEAAIKEAEEFTAQVADEAQDILDNGLVFQSRRPEAVAAREASGGAPPPVREPSGAPQEALEAPPVVEVPRTPLIDRTQLEAALSRAEVITPTDLDNAMSFNFDKMDGPYDAQAMIQAVTDVMQETGVSARLGLDQPETFEATIKGAKEELAGMLGLGIDDFTRRVGRLAEAGKNQASLLVAGKTALQSTGREIAAMSAKIERMIAEDAMDNVVVDNLFDLMDTHVNLQNYLKAAQTQAARLVSAGRIATGDGLDEAAVANLRRISADRRVAARGGQDRVSKLVRGIQAAKTPAQRAAVIRSYAKPRAWDVVNEVFINNILSGYKTHLVNITSNSINVAYLPFERTVGGLIDGVSRGREGFAEAAKGVYQYAALREGVFTGIRLAGRVMRTENPVLDAAVKMDANEGYGRAIRAETFGLDGTSIGGRIVDGLGVIQRIPGRLLMAEDEFFKQAMFRSRLKASLTVDAQRMTPQELSMAGYTGPGEFVEGEMNRAIITVQDLEDQWQLLVSQGKVVDGPVAKKEFFGQNMGAVNELSAPARDALRAAREATFTTPVSGRDGDAFMGFTESYMKMANRHPWLRSITPFIQTPANILSKAWDRLPGPNLIRERYRARLTSPDPAIRAEAKGEMATGVALSTGLYMLALEGRITGGGPQDPRQREIWMNDKSWQPYSINYGTLEDPQWVAINRFDPWATAMGIAGDLSEIVQASENDPSMGAQSFFALLGTAAATNVTNKTYMSGIADMFEMLSGGQGGAAAMQSWAKNYGSAFVPFSSAGRQINQADTPFLQEARAFGDRLKQNVPGLASDLPVRYNWVTGEAMERPEHLLGFIQVARKGGDTVQKELRRLNYGFTGPDRRIGMLQLSSKQYQDWARLMGSVTLGGRTLHQTLDQVMKAPQYDLARERVPDGVVAPEESHRVRAIAGVISAFKEASRADLMMANPELADAWEASMLYQGKARSGTAKPGDRDSLLLDFR